MQKKFMIAATVFAASLPALAGTVMENTAAPSRKLAASQTLPPARAPQPGPAADQQTAPAVKPSGLLNTEATGKQARAVSRDTNRKIARGEIRPQRDTARAPAPGP